MISSLAANLYRNPVIDRDFPDPSVVLAHDGYYYCYATQYLTPERAENVPGARSKDLIHWEVLPDAMPTKPVWASSTQDFWAPHVIEDGGAYYLYFSAALDSGEGMAIGVATATDPRGPFIDSGQFLAGGPSFEHIDPMAFDDPQTGKKLLYWGSGFKPIKVRELAEDRLRFAPGSVTHEILHPSPHLPFENLIEGAFVVFRNGYYYLFYSGDNCWECSTYTVMVARSTSAFGPFEKLADVTGKADSTILRFSDHWHAPGQNSIITDRAGNDWLVYHAVDPNVPYNPGTTVWRRPMLLDKVTYIDGWPYVPGGIPSDYEREGPAV
ncbi:MAG TPA: glycoside hydrolase family 43 protein [Herpetosiphonaceae bacterium]|nr:glycoside hydrolase family 43 protein [Herpetosiphonaceae bacterium]